MTMHSIMPPPSTRRFSTAFTVPEQEEAMWAETKPSASAMRWPTSTASPFLTMGLAGFPMCWDSGNTISPAGRNSRSGTSRLSSLWPAGWTPPRKVSFKVLDSLRFIFSLQSYPIGHTARR